VKEKLGKCCLENVLPLSAQKSQIFELPPKNQISKPLQMKNPKIAYLPACLLLALDYLLAFVCVLFENINSKIYSTIKILLTMLKKKKMYKHSLEPSKKINKIFL